MRVFFAISFIIFVGSNAAHSKVPSPRIVGGHDVDISEYPYQLSLQFDGAHICGASVIGVTTALTSADCVYGKSAMDLTVRGGSSAHNLGGVVVSVEKIIVHPNFNRNTLDYDVAVLILADPIRSAYASIAAISLPEAYETVNAGSWGSVTGWGALHENGARPLNLQKVSVPVLEQSACSSAHYPATITARVFCAGLPNVGGKDICSGDSGNPIVITSKLDGIASSRIGCGNRKLPSVYTRVASVREWIRQVADI